MVGLGEKVQAAIDHFHGDGGERLPQRLGNLIGEIDQHRIQQPGGPELEFNGILRPTPEIGQTQEAFDDMVSVLNAPALPVKGDQVLRRELDGVEFVGEVTMN